MVTELYLGLLIAKPYGHIVHRTKKIERKKKENIALQNLLPWFGFRKSPEAASGIRLLDSRKKRRSPKGELGGGPTRARGGGHVRAEKRVFRPLV